MEHKLLLITLLGLFSIFIDQVQSKSTELTFELPDNAKQCFHEDIAAGTKSTIEFQVVTGGYYDVDMTLYDPRQAILYQGVKKQFDTHQWTASTSGQYTFCFNNEFSTFSHKLVYFEFIVGEEEPLPNTSHAAATAMTKFEAAAENIHENLNSIFDAQTHYRLSEAKGRKRAEDLNSRVFWWSAVETAAVVLIGAVQKQFFAMTLNSSLLQWLATFELDKQAAIKLNDEAYYHLADGYVSARILNQISPKYFSDSWLEGIKPVPPNGSWALRVSNLNRITQKVYNYASDLQNSHYKPSAIMPDVVLIAQNFVPDQISRLIQLILFCAINSDKNEYYVEQIQNLPTQVQQDIRVAIEGLLNKTDSPNQKLNTSQVGNNSFNSETETDIDITTTSSHRFNASSSQSTILSPLRTTNYRSALRRDSSQSSVDTSRKNENQLDTSTLSNYDYSNETVEDIKRRLNKALVIKDEKEQTCHELKIKLKELLIEKDQLKSENERLISEKKLTKTPSSPMKLMESKRHSQNICDSEDAIDSRDISSRLKNLEDENSQNLILQQNKKLQGEVHRLKEEVIKLETEKEDFRLKSCLHQEDLNKITLENDELRKKADQVKRLQDELDEHRQVSEKVVNYENKITSLIEKNNELKRELKNALDKSSSHIRKIVNLEELNNQLTNSNSRIEIYKKQLQETQAHLSQETHRADKAEVELSRLSEKYSIAKKENEKLHENTNRLRNVMPRGTESVLSPPTEAFHPQHKDNSKIVNKTLFEEDFEAQQGINILNSMSTSVIELKERIAKLEYENELLHNKLNTKKESDNLTHSGLLELATDKCTKLEIENRQFRKKIMFLESHLKDLQQLNNGASTSSGLLNESSSDNTLALINRVEELQRILFRKDQELMESEARSKRNIQKAKDVMKNLSSNQSISNSLHPSCISSASSFNSSSLDEINLLKHQIKEREDRIIEVEREFYEFKKFKEIHERLIISAFYGLTTTLQWKNADKRLERTTLTSPLNTASSSINHSKHSH